MRTKWPLRQMSQSPLSVAREALAAATEALPRYSSRFSKRDFTQWQLVALLVLKYFFGTSYRGLIGLLRDWSDLREVLDLTTKIPNYSTLWYAHRRVFHTTAFRRLQEAVFRRARVLEMVEGKPEATIDATGLDSHYVSTYYVFRKSQTNGRKRTRKRRKHWTKQTTVCHTATYLWASTVVSLGPSQDSPEFKPAVRQAVTVLPLDRLLGDGGYDGEENHRFGRQDCHIRSTIFRINKRRGGKKWPTTKYRRQMKRRFPKRVFRHRWHAEGSFSQDKRRLGPTLRSASPATRRAEVYARTFTHNVMILL